MIDIKNIKSTLIFLNEFYYINGINFQDFIESINDPKYKQYVNKIRGGKVYNNLFSLFGIHDKFHDTIVFSQSTRNIGIRNNSNSLLVYYNDIENSFDINITLPSINIDYCHKMDWLVFVFKHITKSNVISYYKTNNHFIIKILINKIKIGKFPSSWQIIFGKIIFPSPNYDSRIRLFPPNKKYDLYLLDEILSSKWKASFNILEIVKMSTKGKNLISVIGENSIKSKFREWCFDVDWLRKRDYILALSRIKNNTKWIWYYFKLDRMIQILILSYL